MTRRTTINTGGGYVSLLTAAAGERLGTRHRASGPHHNKGINTTDGTGVNMCDTNKLPKAICLTLLWISCTRCEIFTAKLEMELN